MISNFKECFEGVWDTGGGRAAQGDAGGGDAWGRREGDAAF